MWTKQTAAAVMLVAIGCGGASALDVQTSSDVAIAVTGLPQGQGSYAPSVVVRVGAVAGAGRPPVQRPPMTPPVSRAVPGPVAGVGLPMALIFGGYIWFRRRSGKSAVTGVE